MALKIATPSDPDKQISDAFNTLKKTRENFGSALTRVYPVGPFLDFQNSKRKKSYGQQKNFSSKIKK